jgi:hypothetical protein
MDQKFYTIKDLQPYSMIGHICETRFDLVENPLATIAATGDSITHVSYVSGYMATDSCGQRCKLGDGETRVTCCVLSDLPADENDDVLSQEKYSTAPRLPACLIIKPAAQVLS